MYSRRAYNAEVKSMQKTDGHVMRFIFGILFASFVCGLYVGKTMWKAYDVFNLIFAVFWAGVAVMYGYRVRREYKQLASFIS